MHKFLLVMATLLALVSGQVLAAEVSKASSVFVATDHQNKSDPNVTDHRKTSNPIFTDHRQATSSAAFKESPLSSGLAAPSGLVVSDITRTTLTLSWVDNSNREFGVELYRIDPVEARRNQASTWEFIGLYEERVDSSVSGTGIRSDEDYDLSPGTNYCYRLRAFSGFDRSEVSGYSEVVCIMTSP